MSLTGYRPAAGAPAFLNPTPGAANGPALMEIAPAVTNVTENPPQLAEQEPLTINATVTQRAGAVNAVKLTYRVGFGSEQTLVMSDTGVGIYSATIPASATLPATWCAGMSPRAPPMAR